MCCRFYMEESPELRPFVEAMNRSPLAGKMREKLARPLKGSGEIRPTDIVPAAAPSRTASMAVYPMVWGFTNPASGGPLVNCRAETAGIKPTWKEAWTRHRCVIPASFYYEWEHLTNRLTGKKETGQKYMIQPRGASVTYLAGLYRIEEIDGTRFPVFAILTREPGEAIRFIHDRMPVILPEELVSKWISPEEDPLEIVRASLTDMVFEKAP